MSGKFKKSKPSNQGSLKGPDISFQYEHPVFCFKNTQKGFFLSDGEEKEILAAIQKIERWASSDWNTILSSNRKGHGHEIISATSLKEALPEVAVGKKILATRYGGKNHRMIGFKDERVVFNILWFDTKLKVYGH